MLEPLPIDAISITVKLVSASLILFTVLELWKLSSALGNKFLSEFITSITFVLIVYFMVRLIGLKLDSWSGYAYPIVSQIATGVFWLFIVLVLRSQRRTITSKDFGEERRMRLSNYIDEIIKEIREASEYPEPTSRR